MGDTCHLYLLQHSYRRSQSTLNCSYLVMKLILLPKLLKFTFKTYGIELFKPYSTFNKCLLLYSCYSLISSLILAIHFLYFNENEIHTVFEWILNAIVVSFVCLKVIGVVFYKKEIEKLVKGIEDLAVDCEFLKKSFTL